MSAQCDSLSVKWVLREAKRITFGQIFSIKQRISFMGREKNIELRKLQ